MSHSRKCIQEVNLDSLTHRFHDSLTFDNSNKPDFKELNLGSPVSPLTARASVNGGTTSTSSSSSSGSVSGTKNHSGELSGPGSSPVSSQRSSRPGHRRSVSAGPPLIYAGSSFSTATSGTCSYSGNGSQSVTSSPNATNILPSGNICPSGKILKTGMASRVSTRTDTLGTGTGNYGHGSIMRGSSNSSSNAKSGNAFDAEEIKRVGNEMYKKANFVEALKLYDKAITLSPENAAYRSNRAAALTALGRLSEAVLECEEAVRLDPGYGRAHLRLASLYLRFGQIENARLHLFSTGQHPDPADLQKLQSLEKHLSRCAECRKNGDWKSFLRETEAAISDGADSSLQLIACKGEALLKLHRIEEADSWLSNLSKYEHTPCSSLVKFLGMTAEAYVLYVLAQVHMTLGRFENALSAAEKAGRIDNNNVEIATVLNSVKMVARARTRGNELFTSGRYDEACSAYGEGLKYDSYNPVLFCNRAVCWSKLGLWAKSIDDCNEALRILPNYIKALWRRAASNGKLGRWSEAVRDYEALRRELPGDTEVAKYLQNAQLALKRSREEAVYTRGDGEVEEISCLEKFKAAIASPGISVVHFQMASSEKCEEMSPFINTLCVRYPSVHFFKVDVEEILAVGKAESIRSVPTFKIYKNGVKLKEMICPSHQLLEDTVRSYSP